MPTALANKIAAGEVVQRPASAAKELIENALDAGADDIHVVLRRAGSELIHVIDNGSGMSPADAEACFLRHATSKITSIDDLERIRTLGFRGEALASIASVAQVELKTKRKQDDAGIYVRIEGSEILETRPCAAPDGTSMAVRNLFFNVPARRNFLKTPATEFKHLLETFQFLALSHPHVAFRLTHDDNEVYRLRAAEAEDPHDALAQRISELFGDGHPDQLVQVEERTSYVTVTGFVGQPEFNRKTRGEQFLFVNGRYIKNRYLEHAVTGGYGDLLPEGSYPFMALFLEIDPRHVDVNVHPTKAEVKFDDERGIYGFLRAVIQKALALADLTPQFDWDQDAPSGSAVKPTLSPGESGGVRFEAPRAASLGGAPSAGSSAHAARRSSTGARSFRTESPGRRGGPSLGTLSERLYATPASDAAAGESDAEAMLIPSGTSALLPNEPPEADRLLWQLHQRYVLTQIHSGLLIVDQQAAHARILYERVLRTMRTGSGQSQQLLFPHTLEFNPADLELLDELLTDLHALGFDIEITGSRSVVVRGVPPDVRSGDERSMLEDILQQYKDQASSLELQARENLARSIARRSAVRPDQRLSPEAMRTLIDQLFQCSAPYTTPDGRPTMIKITTDELSKRFGP